MLLLGIEKEAKMKSYNLIVLGAAPCLENDLIYLEKKFGKFLFDSADYMAIGVDAVKRGISSVKYIATYHPEDIPEIKEKMKDFDDYRIICHVENGSKNINNKPISGVDIVIEYEPPTGSSALLGTLAAIKLGYKKIILCGCPLEGKSKRQPNEVYSTFHKGWQSKRETVIDCVRSVSGWTKEFLGEPTKEWLNV
jgi:hypothetical protein